MRSKAKQNGAKRINKYTNKGNQNEAKGDNFLSEAWLFSGNASRAKSSKSNKTTEDVR
jgi:hypothetical protein